MRRFAGWTSTVVGLVFTIAGFALGACSSGTLPARSAPPTSAASSSVVAAGARATEAAPQIEAQATSSVQPVISAPTIEATPSATSTPTPAPSATVVAVAPLPPLEHVDAVALGGETTVRSAPSMVDGQTVATLADDQPIVIQRELRGQRWVVGDQTWAMATQGWSNLWYQIDGGYVYSGFVYIPRPSEAGWLADATAEHWIDVNLTTQTARAMIGDRAVYTAGITSGKPGFETPTGEHTIEPWGRKFNETMTSTQAGIKDPQNQYDVQNVLYTQYFDSEGDALHLNYWQPESVFGSQRTSHGCVGLQLHDAQFFWLFARPGMRVVIWPLPATATPAAAATAAPTVSATAAVRPAAPRTAVPIQSTPFIPPTAPARTITVPRRVPASMTPAAAP